MSSKKHSPMPIERSASVTIYFLIRTLEDGSIEYYSGWNQTGEREEDGEPMWSSYVGDAWWFQKVDYAKDFRKTLSREGHDMGDVDVRKVRVRFDIFTKWKPDSEMMGNTVIQR